MKKLILTAVAILALGMATSAMAGTATDNMLITLTVYGSCTVSTTDMPFGSVSRMDTSVADASATITVNCSTDTIYYVALDAGLNDDGASRYLAGPAPSIIAYSLLDGATPWGDDTLYGARVQGLGDTTDQDLVVTGTITGWTNQPNGTYTDTVTVTVEY